MLFARLYSPQRITRINHHDQEFRAQHRAGVWDDQMEGFGLVRLESHLLGRGGG